VTDTDIQILKAARMIIVSASSSIEKGAKSGEIGANGVNNLDIAVEFINISHQSLNRVIEIAESHLDPEPHGSRDTFVPHPSEGPEPEQFNAMQD
jgi:hypothetical protein